MAQTSAALALAFDRETHPLRHKLTSKTREPSSFVSLCVALSREKEEGKEEDSARASVFKKRGEEEKKMRFLSLS